MKPVLIAALALSLVANLVLGLMAVSTSKPGEAASAVADNDTVAAREAAARRVTADSRGDRATGAAGGFTWQAVGPQDDLRSIVAGLRAAGFPVKVIRSIVQQLLGERFPTNPNQASQPFWKRDNFSPEARQARQAIERERQAAFEALLGDDAKLSAVLDPAQKARQYGNLSDDKIDSLARIERDYSEMLSNLYSSRSLGVSTPEESQALRQQQEMLEKEKRLDIASLLTPDELEQYDMRNSQSASTVMRGIRDINVSEQEYASLYHAQKAFDEVNKPFSGVITPEVLQQRNTAQEALNAQFRNILGDARFYDFLAVTDGNFRQAVKLGEQFPSVTPAIAYEVTTLQREAQNAQIAMGRNRTTPPAQRLQEYQAALTKFDAQLQALLGAEAAEAYKKTNAGRVFRSPTVQGGTGTPVRPLPGG